MDQQLSIKLVVLGGGGTGKSAISVRFVHGKFKDYYDPTIEDSYRKHMKVNGEACTVELVDTAGQDQYSALRDGYLRDGEGFLLVYSITDKSSLEELYSIYEGIRRVKERPVPIVLIANKADLESDRKVPRKAGEDTAALWRVPHLEASAKNNLNITEAFDKLIEMTIADVKQQEKRGKKKKKEQQCIIS